MMPHNLKGVAAAVCSNLLFVLLFLHSGWMKPMSGTDVFAWRMVAMLAGLLVLVTVTRSWGDAAGFVRGVGRDWKRWFLILLPTPIVASQLWLFMWAPVNGEGVGVAMGYFLFPLMMVLAGGVLFGEKLTPVQKAAVGAACAGVAAELWHTGAFSWATVWVFGTYPAYYLLRRRLKVPALTGLLIDLLLIAPFALLYIFTASDSLAMIAAQPSLVGFIVLLGAGSALAMQFNLYAGGALPVVLFGMLSYLEPALLFVVSVLVLGEQVSTVSLACYSLIWLGLGLMLLDGLRAIGVQRLARSRALQQG